MKEWTDELLCGIDEIDTQHKQLFAMVQDLSNYIGNDKDREVIKETFDFLEDYVKRHFELEEHYMELHKYPGYSEQKVEHKRFHEDFLVLRKKYESRYSYSITLSEVQGSLYHWLETHLNGLDKRMCQFLRNKDKTT
jgi:hemerythrin